LSHIEVQFADIPWRSAATGLRLKQTEQLGVRLRLVEFTPEYDDQAWCEVGHAGYVIEGRLTFLYDSTSTSIGAGEAFYIEHGPRSRHRTRIAANERALVFLFENNGPAG
jgi:quercetin dioxygenase-like cupin family protein